METILLVSTKKTIMKKTINNNKLKDHLEMAYYNNEENFKILLRTIFFNNEYPINERTKVVIKGFFNKEDCRPYFQFKINTDAENFDTEFYRYDYSRKKSNSVDEFEIGEQEIVEVLTLYDEDLI
jgi:hypothetical protein